ncbi:hypothetical protein [Nocardia brasiliensis]|uniref:hypothetical protein n=1 Tax=Nocardia brasiliensis TaxID=37326 RepID=UPI0005AA942C|nr:hypothetical protein [Nocardia brasiliensis]ASF10900.1 hypothetical protein CEQ30_30170 [Nocardia brasiliensis]
MTHVLAGLGEFVGCCAGGICACAFPFALHRAVDADLVELEQVRYPGRGLCPASDQVPQRLLIERLGGIPNLLVRHRFRWRVRSRHVRRINLTAAELLIVLAHLLLGVGGPLLRQSARHSEQIFDERITDLRGRLTLAAQRGTPRPRMLRMLCNVVPLRSLIGA